MGAPIQRDFHFAPIMQWYSTWRWTIEGVESLWTCDLESCGAGLLHLTFTSSGVANRPLHRRISMHFMTHLNLHSILCGPDKSTVVAGNRNPPHHLVQDFRFSQRWLWRIPSSEILVYRRVVCWKSTDVPDEHIASETSVTYQRHARRYIRSLEVRQNSKADLYIAILLYAHCKLYRILKVNYWTSRESKYHSGLQSL
jgi:hypothetical protein